MHRRWEFVIMSVIMTVLWNLAGREAYGMKKKLSRLLEPGVGLFFGFLFCFAALTVLRQDYLLAGVEAAVTIALMVLHRFGRENRRRELQAYSRRAVSVREEADSADVPVPMVLIRPGDGTILWANDLFSKASGYHDKMDSQKIRDYIPNFSVDWLISGKNEYAYDVTMKDRRYRISGSSFRASDGDRTVLSMLYFSDLTELYQVRDEYIRSRPVVAIILVDNYDELTKNLQEGAISALNAQIDDLIAKWCENYHGLLRRLERNRYLFLFEHRYLRDAEEGKFSILEDIHQVTSPTGIQASISCGIGMESESFEQGYNFASLSLEMALSRGGNQAVLRNRYEFSFFGGMEHKSTNRSKVRSRVMADTLADLIVQSEHIYIMGHRNADLDAVGAAMGVACLCRKKGKKASIVLDMEKNAAGALLEQAMQVPEYQNVFISGQEALLHCNSRSLLIVVDTNRPDQVESQPLLEAISKVCIIDHHRRAADYISSVVLNYHETSASSASELVTELLQYTVESADILKIEAKALLAGIFLDTKSFQIRTEDRTFEAAALLKRAGADTIEVKKLLQSDFQNTMAKYQIIKSARLYRQEIAIAALSTGTTRVLAAQAADELLNISGISASFVLYAQGTEVVVSGRSIGDVNVQIILEPLGGGGNSATAGAQVPNADVKDVLDKLIANIDRFYDLKEESLKKRTTGKD